MSVDCAISTAWDVFKTWIAAPIGRQFGYVMFYKSYMADLKKLVGKLEFEMQTVHSAVEEARNNGENIFPIVTEWQKNAQDVVKEARELLMCEDEKVVKEAGEHLESKHEANKDAREGDRGGQKRSEKVVKEDRECLESEDKTSKDACCYRKLPNPKTRYVFSRMARKKMGHIQQLANERNEFKDNIAYGDPPPGIVSTNQTTHSYSTTRAPGSGGTVDIEASASSSVSNDDDVYESRAEVMRLVMNALADKSTDVVGVYGMGGIGKSTLLDEVERQIRKEKLFDVVVKANVSQTPDLKKIQEQIAHSLGLKGMKSVEGTGVRARLLLERLLKYQGSKILIILDNLWKGLDLKEVGIPCGHDNKVVGCKLLLTSRDRDVLRNDMCSDKEFLVNELKEEEARRLFKKIVGSKVDDLEFNPLVDEVLQKCAGLPLLIVSMAKDLKHGTLSTWRDFLKYIEVSNEEGVGAVIYSTIERSYNYLRRKEMRDLFLICGLLESSEIPVQYLLRCCMGVDLLGHVSSMEDARDRLTTLLRGLQASCLLPDSDDSDIVKMHDWVREVAISIASRRDQPLILMRNDDDRLKKWPTNVLKNCSMIFLPWVDIDELPDELECPKLKCFILASNNPELKVPDSFFKSMEELKVLDLTSLCLTSFPSSIQSLENLQTLCLEDCYLEDVTMLGKLRGLQVLSFVGSKLKRLPKEVGELTELRLLDLTSCYQLETIEPGTLGSLVQLEELYMERSFDRWEAEDKVAAQSNACLIELNNMAKLSTLYISIRDATVLPKDVPFGKLNQYRIHIGGDWDWYGEYKELRTLKLELGSSSTLLEEWVQVALHKTQDLYLHVLEGNKKNIQGLCREGFKELKHLFVQQCSSVQYIIQSTKWLPSTEFTVLETLIIERMIDLVKICDGHPTQETFKNLKVVRVTGCDKLKNVFFGSLVRGLSQLEEIEVVNCKSMEEIISDVGAEDDEKERIVGDAGKERVGDPEDEVTLSRLTYLRLELLSSISCFSSGSYTLKFPSLEQVLVRECPNMETFSKGGLSAPILGKVRIADNEYWPWEGDLNTTVQQLFVEKKGRATINSYNLKCTTNDSVCGGLLVLDMSG